MWAHGERCGRGSVVVRFVKELACGREIVNVFFRIRMQGYITRAAVVLFSHLFMIRAPPPSLELSFHDQSTPACVSMIRPLLLLFHYLFFMCGAPAAPDVCLAVLGIL